MLRELLLDLMRFVRFMIIVDDFFDVRRNVFLRLLMRAVNVIAWILWQLTLISTTGGLYLAWVAFKLMRKRRRRYCHYCGRRA